VSGSIRVADLRTGAVTGTIDPMNPNGEIVAPPVGEIDRNIASHSLNFRLPANVMGALDRISISARVFVRGHENEGGGWTAEGTTTVQLRFRARQQITPVLLADVRRGLPAPTVGQFTTVLRRGALARYPVPEFNLNPPITLPLAFDLGQWYGWVQTVYSLATAALLGRATGGIRAGLVNLSLSPPNALGGMGWPRIIATIPAFVSTFASGAFAPWSEALFAHEMGHAHGLNHSLCAGTEPILHDARLPARTETQGMHVEDGVVIPAQSPEIMSYCPEPRWPSIATYDLVFDNPAA
jgi:hypothetical protein